MRRIAVLTACLLASVSHPAQGFGVRTHLYIAEQVYNDLLGDCEVTVEGQVARVPGDVCDSVRANKGAFLAGAIGPDAFPDLVVGQSFAHPGTPRGRQSADWIEIILRDAAPGQQLAFAYGYAIHAAGDVFAHSYVNNYAGDVFEITRFRQKDVEFRHTILEKYIDQRLLYNPDLSILTAENVPLRFIVRQTIEQSYFRDRITADRTDILEWIRSPGRQATRTAVDQLAPAAPALHLTTMWGLLEVARREAREAPCEHASAVAALASAQQERVLAEHAAREALNPTGSAAPTFTPVKRPECNLGGADPDTAAAELKVAEQALRQASSESRFEMDEASLNHRERWFSSLPSTARRRLSAADHKFNEAVERRQRAQALGIFAPMWAADIETALTRYAEASLHVGINMVRGGSPISPSRASRESLLLYHGRWLACYRSVFMGDPIQAADARCERMREMGSMNLREATRMAAIGRLPRSILFRYLEFTEWLDDQLTGVLLGLTRVVAPSAAGLYTLLTDPKRVSREELDDAFKSGRNGQLTFRCVSDWIDVDLGILPRGADSGLRTDAGCLRGSNISGLAGQRLWLNPEEFRPLRYAINLSKLSLLNADGVRNLANNLAPGVLVELGAYPRYSILLDTVRSLDGSYQWHSTQMPYPRRRPYGSGETETRSAGYPMEHDRDIQIYRSRQINVNRPGFPFYQSEALRRLVMARLFPGPFEGEILRRPEFNPPHYPFRPCPSDPFRPNLQGPATVPVGRCH